MSVRIANQGDIVVRLVCNCEGAILRRSFEVRRQRCQACGSFLTATTEVVLGPGGALPTTNQEENRP